MLKLYYAPGACSTASHIGLEESGAKYDSQALAFATNEQKTPEYLKINPRGRVPALVIDEGTIVENTAILERCFTGDESTKYGNAIMHVTADYDEREDHATHVRWLESLLNRLEHYELAPEARGAIRTNRPDAAPTTREVFVIHGHDEAAKQEVARTLERLELKPIILHEQADKGRPQYLAKALTEVGEVGVGVTG